MATGSMARCSRCGPAAGTTSTSSSTLARRKRLSKHSKTRIITDNGSTDSSMCAL
ncbi:hypothetical protein VHUM_01829 [Vanrija humicola]|uniref:Uncharacterized protein n=1 Tax=Vanrija humicola TaxID=5417 RepID=A0A7D8YXF3_VANHU|nr:hypothetical protein VHUM_01829 [Vanrija humicola]